MTKFQVKTKSLIQLLFLIITYLVCGFFLNNHDQILLKLYPDKIWVHRVNSIQKLQEVNRIFKGVELDVVYDENLHKFDVNHPPAKSIDLSLFDYFLSNPVNLNQSFWLDFKNLSKSNVESSSKLLDSICSKLGHFKNKIIVESTFVEGLPKFKSKGFKTSFYLPNDLHKLSKLAFESKIQTFQKKAKINKTDYVSSDLKNIEILQENFPNNQILTWAFNYNSYKSYNPIHFMVMIKSLYSKIKTLSNKDVKIVLFQYHSKGGNR